MLRQWGSLVAFGNGGSVLGEMPEKIQWHPAFYAATELELTVSIFRESYPRKLLLTLEQQGHKIEKIRKETTMCEALRELMKDEIEVVVTGKSCCFSYRVLIEYILETRISIVHE